MKAAANVEFFQRVWEADPEARFYGGTSRDFLWFLRGELSKATSAEDMEHRIRDLERRPIDIREFVVGNSDVDVVTRRSLADVKYDPGFLTKVEAISPEWFEPGNPRFEQEAKQGHVPVEKIQLGQKGFVRPAKLEIGDGVREIYDGRPTVKFDDRIVETELYRRWENHPVLLALRYLRQVAMAYYRRYGKGLPDKKKLLALMEPESYRTVRKIFATIDHEPLSLLPFLENPLFKNRINKALDKAFRSYTNPTAAKLLFEDLGVDKALAHYPPGLIRPYHSLIYLKHRNPDDTARHIAQLPGQPDRIVKRLGDYLEARGVFAEKARSGETYIPMFHGTASMDAYRNIVFQGNIPSEGGNAGAGTYVTDFRSRKFAASYRGDKTLLVELHVSPNARIVDITNGSGQRAWIEFQVRHQRLKWTENGKEIPPPKKANLDAFADFVGADIVRYPYEKAKAYVIKNGAVILGQKGISIRVLTPAEARADLIRSGFSFERFKQLIEFDPSLESRVGYLLSDLPKRQIVDFLLRLHAGDSVKQLKTLSAAWRGRPGLLSDAEWREAFESTEAPALKKLEAAAAEVERNQHHHGVFIEARDLLQAVLEVPEAYAKFRPKLWLAGRSSTARSLMGTALAEVPVWRESHWQAFFQAVSMEDYSMDRRLWETMARQKRDPKAIAADPPWKRAFIAADVYNACTGFKRRSMTDTMIFYDPKPVEKTLVENLGVSKEEWTIAEPLLDAVQNYRISNTALAAVKVRLGFKPQDFAALPTLWRQWTWEKIIDIFKHGNRELLLVQRRAWRDALAGWGEWPEEFWAVVPELLSERAPDGEPSAVSRILSEALSRKGGPFPKEVENVLWRMGGFKVDCRDDMRGLGPP